MFTGRRLCVQFNISILAKGKLPKQTNVFERYTVNTVGTSAQLSKLIPNPIRHIIQNTKFNFQAFALSFALISIAIENLIIFFFGMPSYNSSYC